MAFVCFIDPSFTSGNPSTNSLVRLVEDWVATGVEVEIWSHELESSLAGRVRHVRLPRLWLPCGLTPFAYFVVIHALALAGWLRGRERARHVISTGFLYLPADWVTVHFSHFDWGRCLRRAGWFSSRVVTIEVLKSLPGLLTELILFYNPWPTRLLPVSESVAEDLRRWAAPWKRVRVMPNMVVADRFDPARRGQWRQESRRELGFDEYETILAFAASGHFFRKGLAEAVAAVRLLREQGRALRLLVIGGSPRSLARQRRLLESRHGDLRGWVCFVGMVARPEYYLSAAEAFFFPSRCEAFSLVEIEAAALGLPLLLTRHHGSEMILKDGINGHWLPWDPAGMARVIAERMEAGWQPVEPPDTGRALSREAFRQAWAGLLDLVPVSDSQPPVKPRLLLVGHTYMVAINREKARALADYFEVRVCTSDCRGWRVLGEEITDAEAPGHAGRYELRRLDRWPRTQNYTGLALRGLGAEIRGFAPAILLVENEPWSWLRWQARWLAWRHAPRAWFAEFTWENVERPGLKGRALRLIYRAMAATSGGVIAGNRAAAALVQAAGVSPARVLTDGQLGVDARDFPHATAAGRAAWRAAMGWPENAMVVGFCGRLVAEKGIMELVEALRLLQPGYPLLRLAILGDGPLREALEDQAQGAGMLRVLPPVPHREVGDFLNKLDIFVLPSKPLHSAHAHWEEQFGHVLIEAITAGAFTLGSDSGAIPEVLLDPQTLFHHSDAESLRAALDHWLSAPQERELKRREQRDHCLAHWSHEALARRYADFLRGHANNR